MIEIPYSIAGFVVGAIVGLTGVGGGSLMTPVLVLGFGVPPVTAVGTDLLFAGITKVGGSASHSLKGHVDWRIAALLACGSIPGALVGLAALSTLPRTGAATQIVISTALGVMLVLTALALAFRVQLLEWARSHAAHGWIARHQVPATIATGAFIGLAVTMSSVGAGAIGVTALVLLFPALATSRIVGTDIAHAVPIALLAGLGHAAFGNVSWPLLASLLLGSLPGILLGSHLVSRIPERLLRNSLVAVLLLAGTRLLLG
jgi:uncharacterized membrane protein YfcA